MYKLTKKTLAIFWRHSKKYKWQVIAIVSCVLIYTLAQAYVPLLYRDLIDALTAGNLDAALGIVMLVFVVNLIKLTSFRFSGFVNNFFEARVMADLTNTCYQYLQEHSYGFFTSNFVGSLVTKVRRFERAFEQISDQILFDLGRALLDMVIIHIILLWQYTFFGLIMVAWSVVYLLFTYFYSRFKLPYDFRRAEADSRTTGHLADAVTNNINVKLFANYGFEKNKFSETVEEQFRLRKKSWDLGAISDTLLSFYTLAIEFIIMYFAVRMWGQGLLTLGDIALFQVYLYRIFDKLWHAGGNIRHIYEALADANEMTEILSEEHGIKDLEDAGPIKISKGEIEFQKVSFGYHEDGAVLDNFNFKIKAGERVALIGPSGGGKSTIAKLLFRFYDVRNGKILIDGQDVTEVTQGSLRGQIALVPQDPILFHRSLMENIRYARPDASNEEVTEAARLAHAHEFISSFPGGYHTLVGERGVKLSGGERQRVAIARAILKNAPILVLDEATSSLDSESELYIQDSLKELMQDRTTIVIAHRLSTIMQMDRIVVIDGGSIIEEGKHEELLKAQKGTYQRLWEIQAGGFAAA